MERLHIDLETFSALPIGGSKGVGAFRYVDDPSFEVLLFGYKMDDAPTVCIDLTAGEVIPPEIREALRDPSVVKAAWNAAFERYCLHKYLGQYMPPEQWEDTMILAANCGLPLKLELCCEALHLPQDKVKLNIGRTLIRKFCCPVKPTKKWGMVTRITPDMDPENWALFKTYNIRDVDAEAEIDRMLQHWRPDAVEHRFWCLDARINELGMRVDRQMVRNAMEMDARYKEELAEKAIAVSGIENPNSVSQIKQWLSEQEDIEVPSLNKKEVADVVAQLQTDAAREFMAIRAELSKTSTKKYAAYLRCSTDADPRVRGCFQFFGAHTGRFCLTGGHEVLTPEGWVRLDQWTGGKIITWSPAVNLYSFQDAAPVSFDYEGAMIGIEHQRYSQLSTPEHKMPVCNRNGILEPKTMAELYGKRVQLPIVSTRGLRYPRSGVEIRVLIMTQADGHYAENGDLRFGFKKQRKVERCKRLLRQAEIPFRYSTDGAVHRFLIPRHEQPIWLRAFQSKTFGWWMLNEDPAVIVDELEHWDAYRCGPNSIQYVTTNATNANILQAVCHLGGYTGVLLTKQREKENWSTAYVLNIWLTPGYTTEVRPKHMHTEMFRGRVYCATTPTGYFMVRRNGKVWITGNSGRLVQMQNLPSNNMPDLDEARQLVLADDYETMRCLYPSVTNVLSELLRTAMVADPGTQFVVCDFSAIEARVSAWFAGEEAVLEEFRGEGLIYEATASMMFHVPKEQIKKGGPREDLRKKGKVASLACGYGGGTAALIAFGADKMGMSQEEMVQTVDLWRASNPRIVRIWKTLENAMIRCIVRKQTTFDQLAGVRFRWENGMVFMRLPSGREMAYFEPQYGPSRWNPGRKTISYMGLDSKKKWNRIETWGGRIFENCWAGDTPIVTAEGLKPIRDITDRDLIWDGESFVRCSGAVSRGVKPTIGLNGLRVTPDHKILTAKGWKRAEECDGLDGSAVWAADGTRSGNQTRFPWTKVLACPVRLRNHTGVSDPGFEGYRLVWMQNPRADISSQYQARDVDAPCVWGMAFYDTTLYRAHASGLEELRGTRHHGMPGMETQLRSIQGRHGRTVSARAGTGPTEQREGLLQRELSVGTSEDQHAKHKKEPSDRESAWTFDSSRIIRADWDWGDDALVPGEAWLPAELTVDPAKREEPVYDILNCGPRHRYTVWTEQGPVIAHNCVQATARDCLRDTMLRLDEEGWVIRGHVHDEVICQEPLNGRGVAEMREVFARPIPWAPGLPLSGAGYTTPYYIKD